jgi:hypothetical protein
MRILPIAAVAGFCLAAWPDASAPAQQAIANTPRAQQSVDTRLKRLEEKTDYFQIKKINRKKTWARPRSARADSPAPPGCRLQLFAGGAQRQIVCEIEIAFDGPHPVIATAWTEWTATIKTNQAFDYGIGIGGAGTDNCGDGADLPAPVGGQKQLSGKLLCRVLVNAGKRLVVSFYFTTTYFDGNPQPPPDLVVESVANNVSVITEVLTDFE